MSAHNEEFPVSNLKTHLDLQESLSFTNPTKNYNRNYNHKSYS